MSGKDKPSSNNVIETRPRTPPPTGPIIELRSREVIFAIIIFFLLAVVVGLVVVLSSNKLREFEAELEKAGSSNQQTKSKFIRKDCVAKDVAKKLEAHLNESFDPCQDFWKYACGGFLSNVEIPEGKKSYGLDDEAKIKTRRHVEEAIRSNISRNFENSSERKMKQFYKNCLISNQNGGGAGIEAFDKILKPSGGWLNMDNSTRRKFSQWMMLRTLNIEFDISALFSMNVVKDEEVDDENILQFSPGNLGISSHKKYKNDSSPLVVAYKTYMEEVAMEVLRSRRIKINKKRQVFLSKIVNRTYKFEKSIAMLRDPDEEESQRNLEITKTNVSHFINVFDIIPERNWMRFLQSFSSSINESTLVIVTEWNYFQNLSILWNKISRATRQHYLGWMFMLKFAAPLLNAELKNLSDSFDREQHGRTKIENSEEECLELTKEWFEEIVGAEYVKRNIKSLNLTLKSVREMTENVKKIFNLTIEENTWMDNETKYEAFKKLSTLKYIIGYPENMGDDDKLDQLFINVDISNSSTYFDNMVSLRRNGKLEKIQSFVENTQDEVWLMSSYENNAYYSFTENIVGYPAGLFQAPFYYENACSYINYGSLATTIAHEMLHAFDSTGCRYDHKGNSRLWWSSNSFDEFMQKTNCVKGAYSVLEVDGIPVNGEKTVDENMADIGGVILAYKAYKLWEEENGQEEMVESQISKDLTNEKMFFIAFAQNWCKKRNPENVRKFMKDSYHSIEEIRVRGTLSQVKQFVEAFGCTSRSPMNPSDRCFVW